MLEKMAAAVVTFACLLVLSSLPAYELLSSPVNGTVNGTVNLDLKLSHPETYQQIDWWFNISLKILTKKQNQSEIYFNGYFDANKLSYYKNHTLEIRRLQKQDSSTYVVVLEDFNSRKTKERIRLDVYEPVPQPSVHVTIIANKDEWCNVTLTCSVNDNQVTYRWYKNGNYYEGKNDRTLDVQLKSESDTSFNCTISNPVSQETGAIHYRSPCTWQVSEKNSAVSLSLAWEMANSILAFGFLLLMHNLV
ncbi:CD48 antigen [Carettochelys insculpta]|uniref:CD48 antigen n=1 Tax=Carettochelys insculpta TaxID=44489 RepID=UPI003EBFC606